MDKLIPNSTQIPNVILDCVNPQLPDPEAKCLMYICRRTFGFHKAQDRISFTQFEKGIKDKDGKQLDYGTGLTRPSVAKALRNLIESGAIKKVESNKGNFYEINLEMECSQVVNRINQLTALTKSGKPALPKVVNQVNTQSIRETKGNKDIVAPSATSEKKEFCFKSKMQEMQSSSARRTAQIIALYWDYKGIEFENEKQYQAGYKRELKAANLLTGYSNDRIEGVMMWLNDPNNCDFNWKLETIHKLIDQPNLKSFKKQPQASGSLY